MGIPVLILGDSGSGKSTSLRNFEPSEIGIFNVASKPLPFRKKIPKLIADAAQKDWLVWHFTQEEYGKWKKCSRCGEIKLAHNMFFSKNNTSKDGFYSICKACRNAKTQKNKQVKTINYRGVNWTKDTKNVK